MIDRNVIVAIISLGLMLTSAHSPQPSVVVGPIH